MAIHDLDDQRLVQRAKDGDSEALDALIARYTPRMYRYAHRLTRDYDMAADVVADTFLRAAKGMTDFKHESTIATWMYRILVNSFLDGRKRAANRLCISMQDERYFSGEIVHPSFIDPEELPDSQVLRQTKSERLVDVVKKLPDMQRSMITMFHGEGLSYEEIAEKLDLPVGTVKSRLNRARGMLRDLLDCEHELFATSP